MIDGAIEENYVRIFEKDAERTFATAAHRQEMISVLSGLFRDFGDYSQSLGYVASLLMLLLGTQDAIIILEHLNFDPKYVPGYWKAQAIDFGRDAWVFQALMERYHPDVAAHLLKNGIFPNTYCQKWFSGLCIHVLPFNTLLDFLDAFLHEGHPYLFRFGLSLVEHLKTQLLATTDPSTQFAILRLDLKKGVNAKELHQAILATAASEKYKDLGNLEELRKVAYETKVRPQVEAAQRRHAEVDVRQLLLVSPFPQSNLRNPFFLFFFFFLLNRATMKLSSAMKKKRKKRTRTRKRRDPTRKTWRKRSRR